LVDALRSLDANIEYVDKEGYPPLRIKGKKLTKNKVSINGNVSSQYISALLLIAPSLENGLEIELLGEVTSRPYLEMTLTLLKELETLVVESDWSSASYFYGLVALSGVGTTIELSSYRKKSLQGDNCLAKIYKELGVETEFQENAILLKKMNVISSTVEKSQPLELDLRNAPDIAQTIAVTCFGLGIACNLTGLHTLKIKETDRLVALDTELTKLGADISVTDKSLHLKISSTINKNCHISTYNDHRMAMAFAPLSLKVPMIIENAEVVTKSYISFWDDFEGCFY